MKFHIYLKDNPTATAQEKGETIEYRYITRGGRAVKAPYIKHYEKPEIAHQREEYRQAIRAFLRVNKLKPPKIAGPVKLSVIFYFQTPERKKWNTYKITKPDGDNSVKLLQDCLADEGIFEVGDQQISELTVSKFWSDRARISIEINSLPVKPLKDPDETPIGIIRPSEPPRTYQTPEDKFKERLIKREEPQP